MRALGEQPCRTGCATPISRHGWIHRNHRACLRRVVREHVSLPCPPAATSLPVQITPAQLCHSIGPVGTAESLTHRRQAGPGRPVHKAPFCASIVRLSGVPDPGTGDRFRSRARSRVRVPDHANLPPFVGADTGCCRPKHRVRTTRAELGRGARRRPCARDGRARMNPET